MKKLFAILLSVTLLFQLSACSGGADPTPTPDTGVDTGIQVDEGLFNVEVTLPAALMEDTSEEEIRSTADESGFSSCTIHEDGSVTYTMSKAKHQEVLDGIQESIDETVEDLINGENAVASFQKIEYSDNLSQVDIYVDQEQFSALDTFSALTFYVLGMYYQSFSGADPGTIDVAITFLDASTNEEIERMSLSELLASEETQASPSPAAE